MDVTVRTALDFGKSQLLDEDYKVHVSVLPRLRLYTTGSHTD